MLSSEVKLVVVCSLKLNQSRHVSNEKFNLNINRTHSSCHSSPISLFLSCNRVDANFCNMPVKFHSLCIHGGSFEVHK